MKKSKLVTLVLITSALASCEKKEEPNWDRNEVYMRSDSTATYSHTQGSYLPLFLWYYAFRPYGMFSGGRYQHAGYYSGAVSRQSNVGRSATKGAAIRGGFGGSRGFSASS
jgi:hypothetical protein